MKAKIIEVTKESPFSTDMFNEIEIDMPESNRLWACHTTIGSLTVVDRITGFGYRDVETGYRDPDGRFWLASGGFDVRESGCKTFGEATEWVKNNSNNLTGIQT